MFSLLVVDDEEYAVRGITQGIDWKEIGITKVFEAYGGASAKNILSSEHIDIMICDIEMPGDSGIELLKWLRGSFMATRTIFLTGHAKFSYAQKAVQLDCEDYLLKPVDHEALKELVAKVLDAIMEEKRETDRIEIYNKYYNIWESQKTIFIEHFWQDILGDRCQFNANQISESFQVLEIPMDVSCNILLVLVKVEQWLETISAKDKIIMKHAIRNIASDIILKNFEGIVIEDHSGSLLVIIYSYKEAEIEDKTIVEICEGFIATCNSHIKCHLSCYIGNPVNVCQAISTYKELLRVENENITKPNCVILQKESMETQNDFSSMAAASDWMTLLELGRKEELISCIEKFLESINNERSSKELLDSFRFSIISMIYNIFHKNGILISKTTIRKDFIKEGLDAGSIKSAYAWAYQIITEVMDYLRLYINSQSDIVRDTIDYIDKHIYKGFSCEDIANELHFNPDYLSRVFKKEMGIILSDYITISRMNAAKKLLLETKDKIIDIGAMLGYNQFSHFAKVFRNINGVSPQEFRKKYW